MIEKGQLSERFGFLGLTNLGAFFGIVMLLEWRLSQLTLDQSVDSVSYEPTTWVYLGMFLLFLDLIANLILLKYLFPVFNNEGKYLIGIWGIISLFVRVSLCQMNYVEVGMLLIPISSLVFGILVIFISQSAPGSFIRTRLQIFGLCNIAVVLALFVFFVFSGLAFLFLFFKIFLFLMGPVIFLSSSGVLSQISDEVYESKVIYPL